MIYLYMELATDGYYRTSVRFDSTMKSKPNKVSYNLSIRMNFKKFILKYYWLWNNRNWKDNKYKRRALEKYLLTK